MALPNPTDLTNATRFRPLSYHAHSRSPSRSPVRQTEFTARERDPLLRDLSPESTLQAFEAANTSTSAGDTNQNSLLVKSIVEASASEREVGNRAALAARKLREWRLELSQWPWPSPRDTPLINGFLPPDTSQHSLDLKGKGASISYTGSLPANKAAEYTRRVNEIQNDLEALDITTLKEYVLDTHIPSRSRPGTSHSLASQPGGFQGGHIKDFTALVTATVVQALPDLTKLQVLLNAWEVRLIILFQVPELLRKLGMARTNVDRASKAIRNANASPTLTRADFETIRQSLGERIGSLGAHIDRLLDLLEGREDKLPASWIDQMDQLEADFSRWVVEAQRRVMRNEGAAQNRLSREMRLAHQLVEAPSSPAVNSQAGSDTRSLAAPDTQSQPEVVDNQPDVLIPVITNTRPEAAEKDAQLNGGEITPSADRDPFLSQTPASNKDPAEPKSFLSIGVPRLGHQRGASDVSFTDSVYSAMSDISNAEIVDATSTQLLQSPTIHVVDQSFRSSRDDLSIAINDPDYRPRSMHVLGTSAYTHKESPHYRSTSWTADSISPPAYDGAAEPPLPLTGYRHDLEEDQLGASGPRLDRASTASIELISSDKIRRIDLNSRRVSQDSLTILHSERSGTPSEALRMLTGEDPSSPSSATNGHDLNLKSLRDSPRDGRAATSVPESPVLPRHPGAGFSSSLVSSASVESSVPSSPDAQYPPTFFGASPRPSKIKAPSDALEAKIQDLLTTLPTRVRFAKENDPTDGPSVLSGQLSSRSTTPQPALTLSPAKNETLNRRVAAIDSEVRVYHLTRSGQPRDVPPTKLFVRLVGESGERVMVRVGGGWCDLSEYLRDYSLHHGRRGLADGRMEVADMPSNVQSRRDVHTGYSPNGPGPGSRNSSAPKGKPRSVSSSVTDTGFDFGTLPNIDVPKTRRATQTDDVAGASDLPSDWVLPPVPPMPAIPSTFQIQMPTTTSSYQSGGSNFGLNSTNSPGGIRSSSANFQSTSGDLYAPSTTSGTVNYTPLGAAGPRNAGRNFVARRVATLNAASEGTVLADELTAGARALGGINTPTGSIKSTSSTPASRKSNAMGNGDSPGGGAMGSSPSNPSGNDSQSPSADRLKSRMGSLGDVGGIRRVFLRKKSGK